MVFYHRQARNAGANRSRVLSVQQEILTRKITSKVLTNTFLEGILVLDLANGISQI